MKLIPKALCWVTIPTTSLTLVLLALTIKAPVQIKTIAEQLNQNFHWGIWTDTLQIQSACVLVLAVTIPILLMTVIGLINNNSKLSKDALSYKKENELILEKTANAVGRLSELLGAARMKTGSAGNDMIHGTAHLMRQLEELDASKALSAAELEDRIQKINSDLDFAKELLGYITKKDIAQNASLDELIRAKDALLTRVKELTAVDHQTIVASIAQEVADLTKELATLESLDQRIVEQKAAIANAQVIATAHADEKTGIDAKIAAVEKAIETLNEVLDTIETGDFSETEQLVENVENDSSNLQERVEELKDLIERTDAAKEELKRTLTNLQNVLGVETPTVTTGS